MHQQLLASNSKRPAQLEGSCRATAAATADSRETLVVGSIYCNDQEQQMLCDCSCILYYNLYYNCYLLQGVCNGVGAVYRQVALQDAI
jgi:hypothetical protein